MSDSRYTEDHHTARRRRWLEQAGYRLEVRPSGKRYWRTPDADERLSEHQAAALVRDYEEQALEAAGWESVEVEGETLWRRPDSGRLYPRESAYDVVEGVEKEEGGL